MAKIVELKTYLLRAPISPEFYFSQPGYVRTRANLIVELVAEDGVCGFGEALVHGLQPPEISAVTVEAVLRDLVIGMDPLDTAVAWEYMYNRTKDFGMKGAVIGAISAIDMAMWDLKGKLLGQPVHKLLGGGFRETIATYATGFYRVDEASYPQALVEEAHRHVDAGFDAMKVKIGFGLEADIEAMQAVRDAVGPSVRLMADANHAYNAGTARRLVREFDDIGLYWLEEPISPEDIDGYRRLMEMNPNLLIAAGEGEYTRFGVAPWIAARAVDVLQPDLAAAGGFTAMSQITTLASAAGIMVNPHVWGTAIGLSAAIQFLATVPPTPISRAGQEPMLEYDQSTHPFRVDLIDETIDRMEGRVRVPVGPGLGVTVNREVLEKYDTKGK
jgi:D-galactarolactone cycloisomerase